MRIFFLLGFSFCLRTPLHYSRRNKQRKIKEKARTRIMHAVCKQFRSREMTGAVCNSRAHSIAIVNIVGRIHTHWKYEKKKHTHTHHRRVAFALVAFARLFVSPSAPFVLCSYTCDPPVLIVDASCVMTPNDRERVEPPGRRNGRRWIGRSQGQLHVEPGPIRKLSRDRRCKRGPSISRKRAGRAIGASRGDEATWSDRLCGS